MKIETFLFTFDINPFLAFAFICAAVILYLIKRNYDHGKLEVNIKAQQGTRI